MGYSSARAVKTFSADRGIAVLDRAIFISRPRIRTTSRQGGKWSRSIPSFISETLFSFNFVCFYFFYIFFYVFLFFYIASSLIERK